MSVVLELLAAVVVMVALAGAVDCVHRWIEPTGPGAGDIPCFFRTTLPYLLEEVQVASGGDSRRDEKVKNGVAHWPC